MKPCNDNIVQALCLVEEMIQLADQGDAEREDIGCGILYGVIRDSAYKIKQLAAKEKAAHIKKGWWKKECDSDEGLSRPLSARSAPAMSD
ncbi:MAG: hypothetical protein DSY89_10200 [Deltaproteobacteria bacterium]|nr:MAG: hypothetical protein DSY89_10200 [Deltaproteobacteria bacterium]